MQGAPCRPTCLYSRLEKVYKSNWNGGGVVGICSDRSYVVGNESKILRLDHHYIMPRTTRDRTSCVRGKKAADLPPHKKDCAQGERTDLEISVAEHPNLFLKQSETTLITT